MNSTAIYQENGVRLTFRKSLRNQMVYHHLREVLLAGDHTSDQGERMQFAFIAAYIHEVDGIEWSPVTMADTPKRIEASYQKWLDAIPDYETFNAIFEVVNGMHRPLGDAVQRPNDALTDDERADPN